ncbi:FecR domain-containing protein [uncultured Stenotrophomonas sp.]|uniref:FecR family protein n=1 Tax=uncultured Stenotrophomonas sp. TaxID=165438 RepID=UPI0025FF31B2|nr:FecR domain-containing protein [uncultured Stenotrophomonas sp.]
MNIYRTSPQQSRERAAREAAEWLQVMGETSSDADRAGFAAWVARSPLHLEELLMAQLVQRELATNGALQAFDLDAVLAQAQAMDNVVPLHDAPSAATGARLQERKPAARGRRRRLGWALAAGVAACALLAGSWTLLQPEVPVHQYASAVGEQRSIALADGSMVTLAPASYIAVRFSAGVRDIELRDGEATFDVAHDTSRPFRVHAGDNTVQAVGTRFTVNRLPSGTLVAVSEGKVKVTANSNWLESLWRDDASTLEAGKAKVESLGRPAALSAGEQARIPQGQQAMLRMPLEASNEPVDGKRRLSFRNDTLADIVSEFNRYNPRPIVVTDPLIREQRYSGVFHADDADSFLQFLECCSQLQVSRQADRNVIAARGSRQ